jgi:hypothetical protein
MRVCVFTVVAAIMALVILPACGAYLLTSGSPLPNAKVTISPPWAHPALRNITMTQATVEWDTPLPPPSEFAKRSPYGSADAPEILDVIDVKGHHFGGFGNICEPRGGSTYHCTIDLPDTLGAAAWATVVLHIGRRDGRGSIVLQVHPG